jgi:AcrR family transcriptional regulator
MARRTGTRMPRRTPAETRDLMLRAAVELIRERAQASGDEVLAAALSHLRLTQVAQRATAIVREETRDDGATAITTGAIYQQWPSQADFQIDLLFHIADLQATLVPGLAESVANFEEAASEDLPLETVLMRLMEEVHRHYREDPLFRVELSFLLGAGDPRLRAAIAHRQATFYETADPAWQALLDTYGLQVKHPFAIRDLTRAMAAQIAGAVVVWFADPEIVRDPLGEQDASLMSRVMVAIFDRLTEPASEDG